ncbi:MAG: GNVR domain-containing protein, partial [Bacillota bacterium]
ESQVELEQLTAAKKRMEENLADTPVKLVTRRAYLGESALSEESSTIPEEEILGDGNYVTEEMNPLYLELIKSLNEKDAVIAQTEARIAGMEKSISMLEYEVAELQKEYSTREMEENTLRRKLDTLENTYAILNEKIIQTEITKSVDFGRINFTLVSPAFYPSSPVKPNKSLNVAVAALAGLLLSVLLAFVLEFFDDTVKTPEDLKKIWDLPVMATIPGTKQ